MTNKLPVVGQTYNRIGGKSAIEIIAIKDDEVIHWQASDKTSDNIPVCEFWNFFEELPEDISEKIKEVKKLRAELIKNYNSQQTEQVQEEKEKPKSIWKDVSELPERKRNFLVRTAKFGDLFCWFDFALGNFIMKIDEEEICVPTFEVQKYAPLTDFINAFEQMQKDIQELKNK
jgi:predicted nuclease with TOPRIM domain